VDVTELPEAAREAEVRRVVDGEARGAFDLTQGPLVRTVLIRLGAEHHVLVCTVHHMVTDAWSFRVLSDELNAVYASLGRGRPSELAEPEIQYADFAEWQRRWLSGEVLAQRLAYWREQLAGAEVALALPQRKRRPAVPTHQGRRLELGLDGALVDQLRELSRREGATLYMTLLAGFAALLTQYTGQQDLVVGSVIANRDRGELERLIGFVANTLVLRVDSSGEPSFGELVRRVRGMCLEGYAHQVPPEKLVEALASQRGGATSALYEVWFQLEAASHETLAWPGLAVERYAVRPPDTTFELSLVLSETPAGIAGAFEYDAEVFEDETIRRLAEDFHAVLTSMVTDPQSLVSSLLLTTADETAALVQGFETHDLKVSGS
jgi:hypothetical protein